MAKIIVKIFERTCSAIILDFLQLNHVLTGSHQVITHGVSLLPMLDAHCSPITG